MPNFHQVKISKPLWVLLMFLAPMLSKGQALRTKAELNKAVKGLEELTASDKKVDAMLAIGSYYLNLRGERPADLATALHYQSMAFSLASADNHEKGVTRSIILKADIKRESGDKVSAKGIYQQAIAYATQRELKDQLAQAYSSMGQLYGNEGEELDQKIKLNEVALNFYRQSKNHLEEGNSLKNLGDYYNIKGQPAHAIKLMDTSLLVYRSIGFKELQGIYNNMCITYVQLGDFSNALKFGMLAERTAERLADTSLQRSSINNHLGLTYFYLRNDKKALAYWMVAKDIAEKYDDPGYLQTVIANIATVLIRMKRTEDGIEMLKYMAKKYPPTETQMKLRIPYILFNSYYDIKAYAKAEPYYKELVKFHQKLPDEDINQVYLYRSIIRKLIHDKKFSEADAYLRKHEKQSAAQKDVLALSQIHRLWYDVDSALNRPWSAIAHYKEYKRLGDSIFFNDKFKQIAGLEIEFETQKKDKDIVLLNQRNQLQQVRIQHEERMRYAFIASLLVAMLFVALLYNRYLLKLRSNKVLEQKQKEINGQNELLQKILHEKEWLLREIHHRVKNNLQIVISLLNTQSAYLDNADALVAIRNSQNRMHAMSLIHQRLYQSDNLAEIDMEWYIKELVDYMVECFGTDRKIQFVVDVEAIKLDVAQAVPLGLILNEAISNAIKYAFPDDRKGKVYISFQYISDGICQLGIADDGVGLPEGFDPDSSESLGMSLMTGLTDQLNGKIRMWNDLGLVLNVSFKQHSELSEQAIS